MDKRKIFSKIVSLVLLFPPVIFASNFEIAKSLQMAYPNHVKSITSDSITWHDGTLMQLGSYSPFRLFSHKNKQQPDAIITDNDIRHERFEPFFKKMYGSSARQVRKHLVKIYWMEKVFGRRYPLKVTTVNGVDEKLRRISAKLEQLPKKFHKYLKRPGGSFYWRKVKGESSLSTHSFGIAIDINSSYSNYWLWDYLKLNKPIADLRNHRLKLKNRIPQEIVQIFEDEGFFWGGHWYFYDTMHFEYRPDLIKKA